MINCEELTKYFPIRGFLRELARVHAVEKINLSIKEGETFGLVGESGCGKTTLARTILILIKPTAGRVYFRGVDVLGLKGRELKKFRLETAMVFQDPYSSLNPRMLIADLVAEPLSIHGLAYGEDRENIVLELLEKVGLKPEHMYRYPHEFSGGQRQRLAVARALAGDPKFLVLDEPTSALDVSVQAKILNLLNQLKEDLDLTYMFVSHNLDVIRHISDRIGVMYLGNVVETGSRDQVFNNTLHPYTKGILESAPEPDPDVKKETVLKGEVPSAINPPSGCRFHPRCNQMSKRCQNQAPSLKEVEPEHLVACYFPG